MRDANGEALDRYLGEQDSAGEWLELQAEVERRILEAKGNPENEFSAANVCEYSELMEIAEDIESKLASGKDRLGETQDFQEDSCFFEHVHGIQEERA